VAGAPRVVHLAVEGVQEPEGFAEVVVVAEVIVVVVAVSGVAASGVVTDSVVREVVVVHKFPLSLERKLLEST
jgi:hypothetical protein